MTRVIWKFIKKINSSLLDIEIKYFDLGIKKEILLTFSNGKAVINQKFNVG